MKILHFLGIGEVPKQPMRSAMGGTERVALEIAKRQVALGHQVVVASMSKMPWSGEWEGVQLLRLKPYRWTKIRYRGRKKDLGPHLRLIAFLHSRRFDIVNLHEYVTSRFLPRRPTIMYFHNDQLGEWTEIEFTDYAPRYWNQVGKSDVQVAVSDFVASRLRLINRAAGAGALPESIVTNHSGVDLSCFPRSQMADDRTKVRQSLGLRDSDVLFLFAGALRTAKGADVLAKAFRKLSKEHSNAHLAIAGGSELWSNWTEEPNKKDALEESVQRILKDPIDQKRAFLLGLKSPNELPSIYSAADVFVLPTSVQEGFGLVVLEAFAAVRPVIATRSGGVIELVKDRENGLLVARGDEEGLYQAMRELLRDEHLRINLGNNAQKSASEFSWDKTVQRLEAIYGDLLEKRKSRS